MQRINSVLFSGMSDAEFDELRRAACMTERSFRRNECVFRMGDVTSALGVVLSGSVMIEYDDLWGNASVLGSAEAGDVFAETYALCRRPMMVCVVAAQDCRVLFVDLAAAEGARPLLREKLFRNLLSISAEKNLALSSRIFCTSVRSLRGRVLAYLSQEALRAGGPTFRIPFNRQQMADYLNVDRSALSKELGRMRDDGLVEFRKNVFTLHSFPQSDRGAPK